MSHTPATRTATEILDAYLAAKVEAHTVHYDSTSRENLNKIRAEVFGLFGMINGKPIVHGGFLLTSIGCGIVQADPFFTAADLDAKGAP